MANSKIVLSSGEVLMDLTGDTVEASKLLKGITAHGKDGEAITGTCTYDANTQDATATAAEILKGKTAYNKGAKVTGTMPNNGAVVGKIATKAGTYTVPQGYHDGRCYGNHRCRFGQRAGVHRSWCILLCPVRREADLFLRLRPL